MKLAPKILFFLMLNVVVIMLAIFGYLYLDGHRRDVERAEFASVAIAKENGALIENRLGEGLDYARALAEALGGFQQYPLESRRDVTDTLVEQIAERNPGWEGVWAMFEPGALDGLDAEYAGKPGNTASGRCSPYWYWQDGTLQRDDVPQDSEFDEDYYRLAFDSGEEQVLEPYLDDSTGEAVNMTSFAVPIRDSDGNVVGVAGMDVTLDSLGELSFANGGYQTAGFALLSNQGRYVVHPDGSLVGKSLADVSLEPEEAPLMLEAIKAGKVFTHEGNNQLSGGAYSLITFMPIQLGETGTPWAAEVSIADSEAMADSTENGILMLIALVVTILSTFLGVWITIRLIVGRRLKQLVGVADRQAQGDFSAELTTDSADELGMLFRSLGAVNDNMNGLLSSLRSAAEQVDAGARQISDSSVALAQGATEQASSVEQLTASMEQIASQTDANAQNANEANRLAEKAREDAESGNGQMARLLAAMEEINQSSASISGIIKVIDDIAFQTNILALNAAVEAARAGEHGKGFAVVAEEVRSLAAKSAQAAGEITRMIEESIRKVTAGGRIAGDTARALKDIVAEIDSAAKLVGGIHVASGEQAAAIHQINQGIVQVSKVVEANSATSQQAAAASEELTGQAENLLRQAAQFRLRGDA
jgi:methyl-accepting chemotaxis protein